MTLISQEKISVMTSYKKSFERFLIAAVIICVTTYAIHFLIKKYYQSDGQRLDSVLDHANVEDSTANGKRQQNNLNKETKKTASQFPLEIVSVAEAHENIQWQFDHGYFSEEDLITYKTYTTEILGELVKAGDIRAIQVMGDRMAGLREWELAKKYYWLGAIRGSTASLINLARLTEPDHLPGETGEDRKVILRDAAIEAMAIFKVMELRGDVRNAKSGTRSTVNTYERLAEKLLLVSDDEKNYLISRAHEIYERLQSQRHSMGLGEFDNSTSKSERVLYEHLYDQEKIN